MRILAGVYSILIGVSVLALWVFLLSTNQVPEIISEPASIYAHIAAEAVMALLLVISGFSLIRNWKWSRQIYYISSGLLIYSTINSSGYYIQSGNLSMVVVFGLILSLVVVILRGLLSTEDLSDNR